MTILGLIEKKVYPVVPVCVQNAMVTLQGARFRRVRFGTDFHTAFREAVERTHWSKDRLQEWQLNMLRGFLVHAAKFSPYWRKRFAAGGLDPQRVQSIADLRQFPVLEKSDLRLFTREIASMAHAREPLVEVHTSGTTGTPISVAFTERDVAARFAYLYRMFRDYEVPLFAKSVRFSGRTLFPSAERDRVFWRMNYSGNQMLMSSYHLHPNYLQAYVDRLKEYRPVVVDGYPSSIYVLARFINMTGQSGIIRPRLIVTTAETLEGYQREEMAQAFYGCEIANQYASSEGAPFITENRFGELVLNIDSGVFEFVRPGSEEPAAPGEIAEMLVTSFTTHAYPLIRYRIGDTVLVSPSEKLARNWAMPVVEGVFGRKEDIIYTPFRGYVGRLDPVFKKMPSTIVESQIVQTSASGFILKVVPDRDSGYSSIQLDPVKSELRQRLGEVSITVEELDGIPRGANGKFRAVVGLPIS